MDSYTQRIRDNILPLSVAKTLLEALKEWAVNNILIDHGEADEQCQMCEQENLRYHFGITNTLTQNQLLIGSKCILKFGIAMHDENGRTLSPADTEKRLNALMRQMRYESCVKALRTVAQAESNAILTGALDYLAEHGNLSPKLAFVVLWRLKKHRIDHSPEFFKVALRRDKHKADIRAMQLDRVHLIWPALTTSQRKLVQSYGHAPPSSATLAGNRKMIGPAAVNGWTYEVLRAKGWTDDQMIAHGYLAP
jgi:hypothetical protein